MARVIAKDLLVINSFLCICVRRVMIKKSMKDPDVESNRALKCTLNARQVGSTSAAAHSFSFQSLTSVASLPPDLVCPQNDCKRHVRVHSRRILGQDAMR